MSQGIFREASGGPYFQHHVRQYDQDGMSYTLTRGRQLPEDIYREKYFIDDVSTLHALYPGDVSMAVLANINRIIGKFLERIQEASMVPVEVAQIRTGILADKIRRNTLYNAKKEHGQMTVEDVENMESPEELLADRLDRFNTLSPEAIVRVIRDHLADTLRSLLHLLSPSELEEKVSGRSRFDRGVVSGNVPHAMKKLPPHNFAGEEQNNIFKTVNFLTPESRLLLEIMGLKRAAADEINRLLGWFADMSRGRASLPASSTYHDLVNVPEDKTGSDINGDTGLEPRLLYSTLDPEDYIKLVKRNISSLLAGLSLSLHVNRAA